MKTFLVGAILVTVFVLVGYLHIQYLKTLKIKKKETDGQFLS